MPDSVVRKELVSLNIRVHGVKKLRSGRSDQEPGKDCPPTPHFILSVERVTELSKVLSLRLASVGGIVRVPERPLALQALPALWPHAAKLRLHTLLLRVRGLPTLR